MCERSSLITESGAESRRLQYDKWTNSASTHALPEREREGREQWENTQRQRQEQQHIAGNKDRNNTPLCITYSCLFIAALALLTTSSEAVRWCKEGVNRPLIHTGLLVIFSLKRQADGGLSGAAFQEKSCLWLAAQPSESATSPV